MMLRKIIVVAVFALLVLVLGGPVSAQSFHPGQTIRIPITFQGPDADKIVSISVYAQLTSEPDQKNQPGFATTINTPNAGPKEGSPNTFEAIFTVPSGQSRGDYRVMQITAFLKVGKDSSQVRFAYAETEFSSETFKIENSESLKKPTVKSIKVLP